jgi:GNAT superfamily N-acetyltransferase
MTTDVTILQATDQDRDVLCELYDEVDRLHLEHLPGLFREPQGPVRGNDHLVALLADENSALFIARVADEPVGFVYAIVRSTPDIPILVPRRYVAVETMMVTAAYRKQGIGRLLMNRAHEWARTKGASSVELNVYEFNAEAIAFYEGLNYQTLSRKMSVQLESADG